MPGTPLLDAVCKQIEAEGGFEKCVLDRIRAGETVGAIADTYGIHRTTMYTIRKRFDAREEWEQAMVDSADAHIERAHELADEPPNPLDTRGDAKARIDRADFFLKLAKIKNKKKYGNNAAAVNVNLSVGNLHLEALKAAGHTAPDRQLAPADDIQDADFEVVPDDSPALPQPTPEEPNAETDSGEPEPGEDAEDEDWEDGLSDLLT